MTVNPEPAVKADPSKPYKAIAAFVVLVIASLWNQLQGIEDWSTLGVQDWLAIIIPVIVGTAAVYGIRNPIVTNAGGRV